MEDSIALKKKKNASFQPSHGRSLSESDGLLDSFSKNSHVVRMRQVIVVHERITKGVFALYRHITSTLGPQNHRQNAENVSEINAGKIFFVEFIGDSVSFFHLVSY